MSFSTGSLLLKCTTHKGPVGLLQLTLEELIHSERDSLTRSHTHHTRGNSLIESASTLSLEHVLGNDHNTSHSRLARLGASFLQTGLDSIDGGVGEGTDGTGDQTDEGSLVGGELGVGEFRLGALQGSLELGVCGEVGGLVGSLAQGCEGDTAVQDAEAFFADDGEESVRGAAVLGGIEGVGQTVVLGLETDLDDFHGVDDGDIFGHTGRETS